MSVERNGDVGAYVGRNVARFREQRGLSLSMLATRAGVSKRTLSNLEQGSNVTLDTLIGVADGLDLDLVTLLFDGYEGPNGTVQVVRVGEVEPVDLGAQLVRHLCESNGLPAMTLSHRTLRPGQLHHSSATPSGLVHRLYVLNGTVRFGPVSAPVVLAPGDFATMRADQDHVLGAEGAEATALLLTTSHR